MKRRVIDTVACVLCCYCCPFVNVTSCWLISVCVLRMKYGVCYKEWNEQRPIKQSANELYECDRSSLQAHIHHVVVVLPMIYIFSGFIECIWLTVAECATLLCEIILLEYSIKTLLFVLNCLVTAVPITTECHMLTHLVFCYQHFIMRHFFWTLAWWWPWLQGETLGKCYRTYPKIAL